MKVSRESAADDLSRPAPSTPHAHGSGPEGPDPERVRAMFARISGSYDLLNRVLSAGVDQRWRRRVLRRAGDMTDKLVVDACCGTGDLTAAFTAAGARAIGVDFTGPMVRRAEEKRGDARAVYIHGDALRLPVAGGEADVCSTAFGIRNVADRRAALCEMLRVLRPGGRALVLEFTTPPGRVLGPLYRTYFTRVLPRIGRLISGDGDAYSYLPRSVLAWPGPAEFQAEMEGVGFVDCGFELLTRGVACLHWGTRS